MVHLENVLCFHHRPLFDDESGAFFFSFAPYSLISILYNTGMSLGLVLLAVLAGIGLTGMVVMMLQRRTATHAKPAGYTLLPH